MLMETIAFGMGVNCKGVHATIHVGPSKNLESYVQESGRAGRDGAPSKAIILYHGLLLVSVVIKPFGVSLPGRDGSYTPHYSCCDVCASKCPCVDDEIREFKDTIELPVRKMNDMNVPSIERAVSLENRDERTRKLTVVRQQLMINFTVPLFCCWFL